MNIRYITLCPHDLRAQELLGGNGQTQTFNYSPLGSVVIRSGPFW